MGQNKNTNKVGLKDSKKKTEDYKLKFFREPEPFKKKGQEERSKNIVIKIQGGTTNEL